MSAPATPVDAITTATSGMSGDLQSVAEVGLGIGVTLFVLRKGWKLLKGFSS